MYGCSIGGSGLPLAGLIFIGAPLSDAQQLEERRAKKETVKRALVAQRSLTCLVWLTWMTSGLPCFPSGWEKLPLPDSTLCTQYAASAK
jgi:hypothetical protein